MAGTATVAALLDGGDSDHPDPVIASCIGNDASWGVTCRDVPSVTIGRRGCDLDAGVRVGTV